MGAVGEHLGRGSVSGEPRAPNAAKHSRVQDASKRRDCYQIRSREPGNGDHVYPALQPVPAGGARQCRAHKPVHRGIAGLTQRLAGKLVQRPSMMRCSTVMGGASVNILRVGRRHDGRVHPSPAVSVHVTVARPAAIDASRL